VFGQKHDETRKPGYSPNALHEVLPASILVVDDHEWNRELLRAYLERLDIPVEEAGSGREALEKARQRPPAVIISDWMMPEMDGLELCSAVRADPLLSPVHYLIITARKDAEDLVRAFAAGADDFLSKPINDSELRARVEVGLRLNRLHRELDLSRRQAEDAAENLRKTQKRLQQALERLNEQIHEIAQLQTSYLPLRFPPMGGLSFAAFYRACSEVGGDYYDVFALPDGRTGFAIADVTGHGARAAVCMAMTRSLLRAAASMTLPTDGPTSLLEKINHWLGEQLHSGQFVTMWLGIWDSSTREIHYSRAGHPQGILWPAEASPVNLESVGVPPLGLIEYAEPPEEKTLRLDIGDRLVLYTDGWTESANKRGEMLGIPRFLDALREMEGLALDQIPLALNFHLERFVANATIDDDISLLIIEHTGPESTANARGGTAGS
jgi:sigma-B regulation protein RsbU (phosphoserine phosphatase)